MDPDRPLAASIDLRDGVIDGLDQPDDGRGAGAVVDLDGAVVAPGFIDAHLHLLAGGLSLCRLDLATVRSRDAFERAVEAEHRRLPSGAWLEGGGWSETGMPGRAMPDRTWLLACGDRPAVLFRMDHHACVVNDALLALLERRGLLATDPPGGRIVRDATGRPTGLLIEAAAWMVNTLAPQPSTERRREALAKATAMLLSVGVTAAGAMEHARDVEEVLRDGCAASEAPVPRLAVTLLDRAWPLDIASARSLANSLRDHPRLGILGMKAFLDGTLGSRSARMLDAYADDPGNRGMFLELAIDGAIPDEGRPRGRRLHEWARIVDGAGLSPSMHAIGDDAFRLALEVAEALSPSAHVRIEHCQTISPDDLPRTRGRWMSMQPLHKADDARIALDRLGSGRLDRFFPFRSLLEHGAELAFGSDWPIVSPDPLRGIRSAVTGLALDGAVVAAQECIAAPRALAAYTVKAARMLRLERLGALRRGHHADLVALATPSNAQRAAGPACGAPCLAAGDDPDHRAAPFADEAAAIAITVLGGVARHVSPGAGSLREPR